MIASRRTILAASALSLPLSAPWVTSRAPWSRSWKRQRSSRSYVWPSWIVEKPLMDDVLVRNIRTALGQSPAA